MSERNMPTPEGFEPERPSSNEDFLEDLELKMHFPLSKEEIASAEQAKRDQRQIIQDTKPLRSETVEESMATIDALMASEVSTEQWKKLDKDSQDMDKITDDKYQNIVRMIKSSKPNKEMGDLGIEAGTLKRRFRESREQYLAAKIGPLEFLAVLNEAFTRLSQIESRIKEIK